MNEIMEDDKELQDEMYFWLIGAKILYYRTLKDMTQTELARRIHMSRSALSRIENGTRNKDLSLCRVLEIARGLEVDSQLLLTYTPTEKQMVWERFQKKMTKTTKE